MSVTPQATDSAATVYSKMVALGYATSVATQLEAAFTDGRK